MSGKLEKQPGRGETNKTKNKLTAATLVLLGTSWLTTLINCAQSPSSYSQRESHPTLNPPPAPTRTINSPLPSETALKTFLDQQNLTITPTTPPETTPSLTPVETKKEESREEILARIKENYGIIFTGSEVTPEIAKKFEEIFGMFPGLKKIVYSDQLSSKITVRHNNDRLFTGYFGYDQERKGTLTFDIPTNINLNDSLPKSVIESYSTYGGRMEIVGLREIIGIFVNNSAWGAGKDNPIYTYFAPLLNLSWNEEKKGFYRNPGFKIGNNSLGSTEFATGKYDGKINPLEKNDGRIERIDHIIGSGFALYVLIKEGRINQDDFPEEQRMKPELMAAYEAVYNLLKKNPGEFLSAPGRIAVNMIKSRIGTE